MENDEREILLGKWREMVADLTAKQTEQMALLIALRECVLNWASQTLNRPMTELHATLRERERHHLQELLNAAEDVDPGFAARMDRRGPEEV